MVGLGFVSQDFNKNNMSRGRGWLKKVQHNIVQNAVKIMLQHVYREERFSNLEPDTQNIVLLFFCRHKRILMNEWN